LKSYFLSQNSEIRDGERHPSRLDRLVAAFEDEMLDVYLSFLHGALPVLVCLNLLLQWSDPIIHLLHDALLDTSVVLLGHFVSPGVVTQYKNNLLRKEDIKAAVKDANNYLTTDKILVGFTGMPGFSISSIKSAHSKASSSYSSST
jgi:hypothetical protein